MGTLTLQILDRGVRVHWPDRSTGKLLTAIYGAMQGDVIAADLEYTVSHAAPPTRGLRLERSGRPPVVTPDTGGLLAELDADLVVEIQRLRSDLYVVHAAVLEYDGGAVMLVAKSGAGKSTLAWALLHHKFRYLSDELGPIDLDSLDVHPFPRALLVKRAPPTPYPMAAQAIRTSRGIHAAATLLPGGVRTRPTRLAAIYFIRYVPATAPSLRRLTPAEGAARLYANTLNPLAHAADGIDGAIRIAAARPCFELVTTDLEPTCALVASALGGSPP
jgi:hypothetical protein